MLHREKAGYVTTPELILQHVSPLHAAIALIEISDIIVVKNKYLIFFKKLITCWRDDNFKRSTTY